MPELGHKELGQKIVRLEESPSTNTLVLGDERYLSQHGLVVVARRQTAGRGRMGRTWYALPGEQLYASIVIHPAAAPTDVPAIALIAGLAVAQAVGDVARLEARLKWPNDVQVRGLKVAGILAEGRPGPQGQPRLVIGIGVNCQGSTEDAPLELQHRITTLTQETGTLIAPEPVLRAILARLNALLARLDAGHKAELLIEWARSAQVVGRRVRFPAAKGQGDGIAQGITPEGYLVVEDVPGLRHILVSGEVNWID